MPRPFSQTVIAVVWDFDKTLIAGNMQAPLFAHYGVDERAFWAEVDALRDFYMAHGVGRVAEDVLYLNHILEYVRSGPMRGLDNARLRELGRDLTFHPGIPAFLEELRTTVLDDATYQHADITLEHYVVSTGLRPMVEGSAIRPYLEDVWACEFVEAHHPPGYLRPQQGEFFPRREITALGYQIDNTSKTRALFEINKGTNKHPEIHVNSALPADLRRVPFENMIYVADGPSDVPAWSVVRGNGGRTLGVYQRGQRRQFEQINQLQRDGRIHAFAEADYRPESTAWLWLTTEVRRIADRIVEERAMALRHAVRQAPRHVPDAERSPTVPPAEPPDRPAATAGLWERPPAAVDTADRIRESVRQALGAEDDGPRETVEEEDPATSR